MKNLLIAALASLALSNQAATVVLDFETPLPAGLSAATHSHLAFAPTSAIVTAQYAGFGAIFSGAVLLNLGYGHATSGTNGLAGLDEQGRFNSGAPITLTFFSPSDGQSAATVDFFSVRTDLWADSDNSVLISAFDIGGNLLGSMTYQEPTQNGFTPLVFSGIGQIHSVVLDPTLNDMASGIGGIQFDLISYSTPVAVPEPGTILLLFGAGVVAFRRTTCR